VATTELAKAFATFFLGGFVSLFTIINPPATIPYFTSLAIQMSDADARRMARRACVYGLIILIVSLFAGSLILSTFGISYGALRIAGGIVVALLGHGMLYGKSGESAMPSAQYQNPAFFPLALPGITGPGTIAVVIGISTEIRELAGLPSEVMAYAGTLSAMLAVCLLELLVLRSARAVAARMGPNGIEVMTRLMGFLLICVGVQFIASGVRAFAAGT
jgi:multiple antibiotic resistance protein